MSSLDGHFLAGLALLGGPLWFAQGFGALRRKRLIENTPTSRIRSMAMGLVEVNGAVECRSQLAAPFSGRPCVYWQVEIDTRRGKRGWHTVHRRGSGQPFYLHDGTAAALVYPSGAECRLNHPTQEECLGISLPEVYADYLKRHCGASAGLWRLGAMRFRERILEETQRVYVLGTAAPMSRALTISDGEEMAATGTDDRHARRRQALTEATVAVIRRGENEQTFIISQDSEKSVTFMLGAKALLGLVGGPIAALFGLGWWLNVLARAPWWK